MVVDALACIASALLGTSTSGAYIESATGIREGARTGLAAVTTGVLFLAVLPFAPAAGALQALRFAYAPPLILVGMAMLESVRRIDFEDVTEYVPALASVALMAFTYNIANGLTAGLVLHPILKLLSGRGTELGAGSVLLGALCLAYYLFGVPH